MKTYHFKFLGFLLLAIFGFQINANAQTLVSQDFSTWPPQGWVIENQTGNWSSEFSVQAGGQPPEARLNGSPSFFNTTRLISPVVNLSGISIVRLEFNYMMDVIAPGFSIGVATRNGNSPWQTVWSTSLYSSTSCITKNILISNSNTNQSNFQFCLFFLGNSQNINAWYIDDVRLFVPPLHDVGIISYLSQGQFTAGEPVSPQFSIRNLGLSNEALIPMNLQITDSSQVVIYSTTKFLQTINAGDTDTVAFPTYNLPQTNCVYKLRMIISLPGDNNHTNDTITSFISTFELINKKFVLLELGTVTWCPHCAPADVTVDSMLTIGNKLAVICYHGPYGDPFNNTVSNTRLSYYNILGFPTAYFDGVISHTGSSSSNFLYPSYYQQRVNVKTPFDVQIYGSITNDDGTLKVIIRKVAPLVNPNLVLRVFLTESDISYVWQTQTHINHTARMMITGNNGTVVDLVNNVNLIIPLNFTKNSAWVAAHCDIIAFVQDTVTKEVFQVEKVNLNTLSPIPSATISGVIRYDNVANTLLHGVKVDLMQGPFVIGTILINADGFYSFPDVLPGSYTLKCTSTGIWGGANSIDALMIMKHFTGISMLNPFRVVAADVDASNFLNTVDALTLSKRFVGYINSFTKGDWVFDSPVVIVTGNQNLLKNIKGICRGDVNGSFNP